MKRSIFKRTPKQKLSALSVLIALALSGCAFKPEQLNPGAKIGARYEAPVSRTKAREIDLVEVGKLNLKLASAYYAAGQFQTAQESAAVAVEALPGNVSALGMAALVEVELRNAKKAQDYFDRAFKLAPGDADLNHNYALYLCRTDAKNDPALAMAHFKAALAVDGYARPASSLSAGGDCLVKLGRDDQAIDYYNGALRYEPSNQFALMGLAELQFRRGASREALDLASRLSRAAPVTPALLWLQIRIAKKLGLTQDERGFAVDLRRTFPAASQTALLEQGKFN